MLLAPCPEWRKDADEKLPDIAQAANSIVDFIFRQNPRGYVLGHGDLKNWHRKLFAKVAPVPYYAGNYRGQDTSRPCLDIEVAVGGNPGVPAAEVETEMKRFSDSLRLHTLSTDDFVGRAPSGVERLRAATQLAALAGGEIIRIHPFVNGNGRTARLAMNFFLNRYQFRMPFYIDRPTHPRYSASSEVAMREGNYTPLYQYLVEIIAMD